MSGTLASMEAAGWVAAGHRLHGLAQALQERDLMHGQYELDMETTNTASIHSGAMTVKVKKGREGRRQDYQVFSAHLLDNGEYELAVMQVEGLARITLPAVDAGEDAGRGGDAGGVPQQGGAAADQGGGAPPPQWTKKIAYGWMASCEAVAGRGLLTEYSQGPRGDGDDGGAVVVHTVPSILRSLPMPQSENGWYRYAVELQHVRCTVVEGRQSEGTVVFLPYVPLSSHG